MKEKRYMPKPAIHFDHFWLVCAKCKIQTNNEYLGWDDAYLRFRSTCPHCGEIFEYKLNPRRWKNPPR